MPTVTTDNSVSIEIATIKSVTVDQVKRSISVKLEIPLNGDNFIASGKLAFWAFEEDVIKLDCTPHQRSFEMK